MSTATTVHQHVITALVENETGTLNRLTSLFRRRGFSLASLNAGDCEQPGFSRLTFVIEGDDAVLSQCLKQLEKLLDVVEVQDLSPEESLRREMALIRIEPPAEKREAVYAIVSEHGARTPRATQRSIAVEYLGWPEEIQQLVKALSPYNVTEVVRTGLVAMRVV